jgi:hypothetical protein
MNLLITYCDYNYLKFFKFLLNSVVKNTSNIDTVCLMYIDDQEFPSEEFSNFKNLIIKHFKKEYVLKQNIVSNNIYSFNNIKYERSETINYSFMKNLYDTLLGFAKFENIIIVDADIIFLKNFNLFNENGMFFVKYSSKEYFNNFSIHGGFFGGTYKSLLEKTLIYRNSLVDTDKNYFGIDEFLLNKYYNKERDIILPCEIFSINCIKENCVFSHLNEKELFLKEEVKQICF